MAKKKKDEIVVKHRNHKGEPVEARLLQGGARQLRRPRERVQEDEQGSVDRRTRGHRRRRDGRLRRVDP